MIRQWLRPRVWIPVLLLMGGGLTWRLMGARHLENTNFYRVKPSDFVVSVTEGGYLAAVREVSVRSEVEGTNRVLFIVPQGKCVRRGELVVELDSADLRERQSMQELSLQSGQENLIRAEANLAIMKSQNASLKRDAEQRIKFAEIELLKYQQGAWPQLHKALENKILIAREESKRAITRFEITKELFGKKFCTKNEYDADDLADQRKKLELAQAQLELEMTEKYDYPKQLEMLTTTLENVREEVKRVGQRCAAGERQADAELNLKKEQLVIQKEKLQQIKTMIRRTRILAPQDGMVVYADPGPNATSPIETGAMVRERQELLVLPDISTMCVKVRIHESRVHQVHPGLKAQVTIDSLPDRHFRGRLTDISLLPDASGGSLSSTESKYYSASVVVEEALPNLKPGVSARAEIIVTTLHDALIVPLQAVTDYQGKPACYIQSDAGPEMRMLETGLFNDKFLQVRQGVKKGELVYLSEPEGLESHATDETQIPATAPGQ